MISLFSGACDGNRTHDLFFTRELPAVTERNSLPVCRTDTAKLWQYAQMAATVERGQGSQLSSWQVI